MSSGSRKTSAAGARRKREVEDSRRSRGRRVAVVDEDGVVAGHPRPAGDRGDNRVVVADGRGGLDAALNSEPMIDSCTNSSPTFQPALGGELRHARRGAGAAGRAVDRLVAVEHGVAGMGLGRSSGRRSTGCGWRPRISGCSGWTNSYLAFSAARSFGDQPTSSPRRVVGHVAEVLLRLDDGVEVAAIATSTTISPSPGSRPRPSAPRRAGSRHVGQPHLLDEAAFRR